MQDSNSLFIAFCEANKNIAENIRQSLDQSGFRFEFISDRDLNEAQSIGNAISNEKGNSLLLISDNFLKSEACMNGMLSFIENQAVDQSIQYIITEGRYPTADGQHFEPVETSYDRVSSVIKYMNYWQEKYLEMRKIKRTLAEDQLDDFNKKLQVVKSISAQIGDFLRLLRTKESWTYDQMAENNFARLFNKFGSPEAHEVFKSSMEKEAERIDQPIDSFELEHDLSQLPGIDLLTKASKEVIPPIVEEKIAGAEPIPEPAMARDEKLPGIKTGSDNAYSLKSDALTEGSDENDFAEQANSEILDSYEELQAIYDDEDDIVEDITEDFDLEPEDDGFHETPDDGPGTFQPDDFQHANPGEPEQLFHKVSSLVETGEIDRAFSKLEEFIKNHPDNSRARFLIAGLMLAYRKDTEAAQNQLLKVVEIDPSNHEAYQHLGELAESRHDYILSKKYYEKVVKLAPKTQGIYYKLGSITNGFFKDNYKLAAKYFKKAIKENKKNVDAWYRLGVLYNEHFDKPKKAEECFKRTLSLQKDHPFANYDLALLYHSIGDPHRAASYYRKACRINPEIETPDNDKVFRSGKISKPEASSGKEKKKQAKKEKGLKIPKFVKKLSKSATAERMAAFQEEALVENEPGKIVLITGATAGIGKATAQKFAENGYRLILNGRRTERLEAVQKHLSQDFKAQIKLLPFDVRNTESVKKAIKELDDEWRQVDILINNAGLAKGYAPIHDGELDHWETMIDTNIKGLLYLTRAIAPHMVKRRSGHIINVCSSAGHEVYPNGNVYCATKFAVDALTKSMRLDLHKYNIRIGQVSPGHVEETEFAYVRYEDKEKARIYEDFQPLKSSDVAEAIYFIATAPLHVNIQDIQMMGTQQASNNFIDRSGR